MPKVNGLAVWQKVEQEKERKSKEKSSEISRISETIMLQTFDYSLYVGVERGCVFPVVDTEPC